MKKDFFKACLIMALFVSVSSCDDEYIASGGNFDDLLNSEISTIVKRNNLAGTWRLGDSNYFVKIPPNINERAILCSGFFAYRGVFVHRFDGATIARFRYYEVPPFMTTIEIDFTIDRDSVVTATYTRCYNGECDPSLTFIAQRDATGCI